MSNFTPNNVEIFWIFTKSGIFTRGHRWETNPYQDVIQEHVQLIYLLMNSAIIRYWVNAAASKLKIGCILTKVLLLRCLKQF